MLAPNHWHMSIPCSSARANSSSVAVARGATRRISSVQYARLWCNWLAFVFYARF